MQCTQKHACVHNQERESDWVFFFNDTVTAVAAFSCQSVTCTLTNESSRRFFLSSCVCFLYLSLSLSRDMLSLLYLLILF